MSVTNESLDKINHHWAIEAIGKAQRERSRLVAQYRLVNRSVGKQLKVDFVEKTDDERLLERVATAYELAAIEGIESLLHPSASNQNLSEQAQTGAYRAYELRCVLPLPKDDDSRAFHILHLAALAYCGDRWTDLRRWLRETPESVKVPSVAEKSWDSRLLFRLFDCWIRLLRKNQWDDLDGVREIIAGLREDQKRYEGELLEDKDDAKAQSLAYRLMALYHWAKGTELLAVYMIQGEPASITTKLDQQFEAGCKAAMMSGDAALEVLLRWLHIASRRMVASSIWWVAQAVNSRVTRFVNKVTKTRSLFELLPPQRAALQEQGLLDQANKAVVVNLPTSGGKTVLAQFRILQALNQFEQDQGWVAYVAPTRALVSQITRRLRADFEPLQVHVEQLTSAIEIDSCEEALLSSHESSDSFHVLVTTPEKLSLVIRNKKVPRPLALVVLDEAHNIEDQERGLRIELLLATIKQDCPSANYLLLMPNVPNAEDLTRWLAPESGKTISIGTSAWLPNERIVGVFDIERDDLVRGNWSLSFETLTTTTKTVHLKGRHPVGSEKPLDLSYSKARSLTTLTAAMAKVFCEKGTSIAVARTIPDSWSMARTLVENLSPLETVWDEIKLVQRFLAAEISPEFELINMLERGVAVHHSGLSEETRALVEWLTEIGKVRVLCATTTIAQGINFPVSSVFLATRKFPYGKEMSKREFWNLAGRAGRIEHDSVGIIGIAAGSNRDEVAEYVRDATEDLISRLVSLLNELDQIGLNNLSAVIEREEWTDFRSYVAHLWNEKRNLDMVLAETEQLLRNTFGYGTLQASSNAKDRAKATALLQVTKRYASELSKHPQNAQLADSTGFSPEGVRTALLGLGQLERRLKPSDWEPSSLFGSINNSALPQLVGVMMKIPQIKNSLEEMVSKGKSEKKIAEIAQAWVAGMSIGEIAQKYFQGSGDHSLTDSITKACKDIYKTLANAGTWGLAALSKMPTSGLDFEKLPEETRRIINNIPAMLYHGVNTQEAVLMRINSVPRSVAKKLGEKFAASSHTQTVREARKFLKDMKDQDWQSVVPKNAKITGADYRQLWLRLSGEKA